MCRIIPLYTKTNISIENDNIKIVKYNKEIDIINDLFDNASKYFLLYIKYENQKFYLLKKDDTYKKEINEKEIKYLDSNYDIDNQKVVIVEKIKNNKNYLTLIKKNINTNRHNFGKNVTNLYYYVKEDNKYRLYRAKKVDTIMTGYTKGKLYTKPKKFNSVSELVKEDDQE